MCAAVGLTQEQRAAASCLRTLAFKNDLNKERIVECNALPLLVIMLHSDERELHYEAVGAIGNLVHSAPLIKKAVLDVRVADLPPPPHPTPRLPPPRRRSRGSAAGSSDGFCEATRRSPVEPLREISRFQ